MVDTDLHSETQIIDRDELIPYSNNPKEHPDAQVKKIASSIKNYGWDQPIVVDEDYEIIKGHGRLQAAEFLDLTEVPVIVRDDLTDAEKKASRIADNKTAESDWIDNALETEMEVLETNEEIELDNLGFDDEEIDDLLNQIDGEDSDIEYTDKIKTPEYEPTQDEPPALSECYDTERYEELISALEDANVSGEFEQFLRFAAQRHIIFDYENIAEFFAHQDGEKQRLMELLTLVIVDYDQAVEQGFITFADNVLEDVDDA